MTRLGALVFVFMVFGIMACSPQSIIQRVERGRASPEPSVGGGAAAPGSVEETIQQVITRANAAQVDAIASRDPSLMRETATDRYYRDAERINQELLDNGVTKIELLQLEWGPVSVRGNSAEATTWETWATTAGNGRTVQSRDRNIYRLVQQEGSWKIQSNEHPDQREQPQAPQAPPLRQRPQI
jgi:hypothetical protein